ncbi:hypothetical protein [Marivita lacus]|nr:hypothetical protein [Marivita lacus]
MREIVNSAPFMVNENALALSVIAADCAITGLPAAIHAALTAHRADTIKPPICPFNVGTALFYRYIGDLGQFGQYKVT